MANWVNVFNEGTLLNKCAKLTIELSKCDITTDNEKIKEMIERAKNIKDEMSRLGMLKSEKFVSLVENSKGVKR